MSEQLPSKSEENGLKTLTANNINILSVGNSTVGWAEAKMCRANPNRRVIATTLDEQGAEQTMTLIKEQKMSDRIEVKIEDVSKPAPYPDSHFDFIYARLVFHYLNDAKFCFALGELYRVLKPGGKMFIATRSTDDYRNTDGKAQFDPSTGLTKHTTKVPGKFRYRRFHTQESMETALCKAGFEVSYSKEYQEQLCSDYMREILSTAPSAILETLAIKPQEV